MNLGKKHWLIFLGITGVCVAVIPWLSWLTAYSYGPGLPRSVVISHRGNGFGHPENTVEAVEAAALNGFKSEIDVHLTKDEKIVVFHDFTVDSGNCRGKISELQSAALTLCDIPLFDLFSNYTNRHFVGLVVHVKGHSQSLINKVLGKLGPGDSVFIDSVNSPKAYIKSVHEASLTNPAVQIIYNVQSEEDVEMIEPYIRLGDCIGLSTRHMWRESSLFTKSFKVSHGMVGSHGGGYRVNDRMMVEGIPLAFYETDFPNEVVTGSVARPPPEIPYILFAFPILVTSFLIGVYFACLPEKNISRKTFQNSKKLIF